MKTIKLVTVYNSQEAALIKGNLENHGIQSIITNDIVSTLIPYLSAMMDAGIHILVYEKDFDIAYDLISPNSESKITCPDCNSENVRFSLGRFRNKLLIVLVSLITLVPFTNYKSTYYCKDCRYKFKR